MNNGIDIADGVVLKFALAREAAMVIVSAAIRHVRRGPIADLRGRLLRSRDPADRLVLARRLEALGA